MEQNTEQRMVEVLKENAIITLQYNRSFYQRLVMVFTSIISDKTPEDIDNANKQILDKNITEPWVANYETMLYLIQDAENFAKKNGMTMMVPLEQFEAANNPQIQENPPADQ
jgi:hypothetical protein